MVHVNHAIAALGAPVAGILITAADLRGCVAIAEAVLFPIYGQKAIRDQRPYVTSLSRGKWTVDGAPPPRGFAGGSFHVVIRQRDAQIGKIEPVEQTLFQNQEKWEQSGDVDGTVASVLTSSEMNKVRALVKGGTLEPLIDKDFALGQMYRVNQTPTTVFHYKGQTYPYPGVMTYDTVKQFLEQLLSQK